jgi:hypothetical protein
MKPETQNTVQSAIWGAVGGGTAAIIIGFAWGGWKTTGGTQKVVDEALLASQAAICVAQFMKVPNLQEKLNELKELSSYNRRDFIHKGGWDKMPGQQDAVYNVGRACADGLELLMEK